jgi:hypothetical protein
MTSARSCRNAACNCSWHRRCNRRASVQDCTEALRSAANQSGQGCGDVGGHAPTRSTQTGPQRSGGRLFRIRARVGKGKVVAPLGSRQRIEVRQFLQHAPDGFIKARRGPRQLRDFRLEVLWMLVVVHPFLRRIKPTQLEFREAQCGVPPAVICDRCHRPSRGWRARSLGQIPGHILPHRATGQTIQCAKGLKSIVAELQPCASRVRQFDPGGERARLAGRSEVPGT